MSKKVQKISILKETKRKKECVKMTKAKTVVGVHTQVNFKEIKEGRNTFISHIKNDRL